MARKLYRRDVLRAAAALGGTVIAAACVPGQVGSSPTPGRTGATASPTGTAGRPAFQDRELIVAYNADLNTMDPALIRGPNEFENALHMYNGLVRYDWNAERVEVAPDLAEDWDVSDDGLVWTFRLRQGVEFHKGYGELTSEDVRFHYERLRIPDSPTQATPDLRPVDTIEAPDPTTVRFTMKNPYPNFLAAVAAWRWTLIPSKKAVEEFGEAYAENPIGTGPYVYDGRTPRQEVRWVRNENYFDELATIARVKMVVIPDQTVAALALQRGEVHAMKVLTPDVFRSLQGRPEVHLQNDPGTNWYGFILNGRNEPLSDVNVRRALAHAIDRDEIVAVYEGMASPAWSFMPPPLFGHTSDVPRWEHDPDEARRLLSEAGYPDGFTIEVTTRAEHEPYSVIVADQWRRVGVTANVRVVESGAFAALANSPDSPFEIIVGGIGRPTAEQFLVQFDGRVPPNSNYAGYNNARVIELIDELADELNPDRRTEILHEIQEIVADEVANLIMFNLHSTVAYNTAVTNYARNFVNPFVIARQMWFVED